MTKRRGIGGWVFFALVLALCLGVSAVQPLLGAQLWQSFLALLVRVLPALGLVLALMFVAQLWLTRSRIERWLGRGSGRRGWWLACAAGALSTGPIYPWYALLAELCRKGMRTPLVAVFLYSRALKPQLLPLMALYFGVPFVLVVSVLIVIFALASGLAFAVLERHWTFIVKASS